MKIFRPLCFLILWLLAGCQDDMCDPGPYEGELTVKLTINNENPEVHLVIFRGKIENHDTLISEYLDESPVYYQLDADNYYSATARYVSGFREILAVDGKRMETSTDDDGCDYGQDMTLNLKLAD